MAIVSDAIKPKDNPLHCEIVVRRDYFGKKIQTSCGASAAWYVVGGNLTSAKMKLCDRHARQLREKEHFDVVILKYE